MLGKKFSISKNEFSRIYKKSRRINAWNFVIKFFPNKKDYSQFSIVIGKKIAPHATDRNHIRRIIKKWIRDELEHLPKNFYIIIIVKNNFSARNDLEKERNDFLALLNRIDR